MEGAASFMVRGDHLGFASAVLTGITDAIITAFERMRTSLGSAVLTGITAFELRDPHDPIPVGPGHGRGQREDDTQAARGNGRRAARVSCA